jgi:hypothetical protein
MDWYTDFGLDSIYSAIGTFMEKLVLDRDNNIEDSRNSKFDNLKLKHIQIPKGTESNIRLLIIIYLN